MYGEDPYSNPERYGLEIVGSVEFSDECHMFDKTVVWKAEDGTLYWGDDNGCSCPSPFESVTALDQLATGNWAELAMHLGQRYYNLDEYTGTNLKNDVLGEIGTLIMKVREQ